jgi:hypothetical protein
VSNQIWDIGLGDLVETKSFGWVIFLGFFQDGLECKIFTMDMVHIIPASNLILPLNSPEAPQQNIHPVSHQLKHQ